MKLLFYALVLFFVPRLAAAQNIVPNAGFEYYSICPSAYSEINNCTSWYQFTNGTPDYYNSCCTALLFGVPVVGVPNNSFGTQASLNGHGYAGIHNFVDSVMEDQEYIATDIPPLHANVTYEVTMWVSLADYSKYATNSLGIYFFNKINVPLTTVNAIAVTPQVSYQNYGLITDKTNWVKLTADYKPDLPYTHMVIGSFKNNNSTQSIAPVQGAFNMSYYYIDSVSVNQVLTIASMSDTIVCPKAPLTITYATFRNYGKNNIFTAQLSDKNGGFSNPVNIGYVLDSNSGQINCMIPDHTPAANHYKIRIIASDPLDTSATAANELHIKQAPENVVLHADSAVCTGEQLILTANSSTLNVNYSWTGPGNYVAGSQNASLIINNVSQGGYYVLTAEVNGCTTHDSLNLIVHPTPQISSINCNAPVCPHGMLKLKTTSNLTGVNYIWTGPAFKASTADLEIANISWPNEGYYTITLELNNCYSAPDSVYVHVIDSLPQPYLGSDTSFCLNDMEHYSIGSIYSADIKYEWSTGDTTCCIITKDASKYILTITNGCTKLSDSINVVFIDDCSDCLLVPDAFTPNNDGINDKLSVIPRCIIQDFEMKIFNRYGQCIFTSDNITEKWDGAYNGERAMLGTYFYLIRYTLKESNTPILKKGNFILIQ